MYKFFALLNRMKWINRWGLMKNTYSENLQEHSHQVAILAHALCVISNEYFKTKLNPERAAVLATFHDVSEIITGDMPTPIKYANDDLKNNYKNIERAAANKIISLLPKELKKHYDFISDGESEKEWPYVKAADTLSAYIKCLNEINTGNNDFADAKKNIGYKLDNLAKTLPALRIFLEEYLPAYTMPIDGLSI
ncbi:MAG: 5'-deoxynucleotidase [Clostridiales bacterium]|nr:5'-deoxynucleotidase [Clostridiales bacterium]